MSSILLTHGYFLCDDPKEQEIMKPYAPLGILYISAYLEEHGYENTVFDSTFSSFEELSAEVLRVACLLYTSDAADERSSVDLGGRRIIKKNIHNNCRERSHK